VAVVTLGVFGVFGTFLFVAQYLQLVAGLSPLEAGLWMLPSGGGAIAGSVLVPVVAHRLRPAFTIACGLALMAVGFGLLMQVGTAAGLALVVAASILLTLASGLANLPATGVVVGVAPPERAGAAAAISQTGFELGGALGIAVLGSIGAAVYRGRMVGGVPAGVSPEAAQIARDTLGGALGVALQLPGDPRVALLDAARASFTEAFQVAAGVSAAIALGLAVATVALLQDERARHPASEKGARRERPRPPRRPPAAPPERRTASSSKVACSCRHRITSAAAAQFGSGQPSTSTTDSARPSASQGVASDQPPT
jgi:DHA2 family multidrug resistance protein-like MFS transporter